MVDERQCHNQGKVIADNQTSRQDKEEEVSIDYIAISSETREQAGANRSIKSI
jgi:hypothetical protein